MLIHGPGNVKKKKKVISKAKIRTSPEFPEVYESIFAFYLRVLKEQGSSTCRKHPGGENRNIILAPSINHKNFCSKLAFSKYGSRCEFLIPIQN